MKQLASLHQAAVAVVVAAGQQVCVSCQPQPRSRSVQVQKLQQGCNTACAAASCTQQEAQKIHLSSR